MSMSFSIVDPALIAESKYLVQEPKFLWVTQLAHYLMVAKYHMQAIAGVRMACLQVYMLNRIASWQSFQQELPVPQADFNENHSDSPKVALMQRMLAQELLGVDVGNPWELDLGTAWNMYDTGSMCSALSVQQLCPIIGMGHPTSLVIPMDDFDSPMADSAHKGQCLLNSGDLQSYTHLASIDLPAPSGVDFVFPLLHVLILLLFQITSTEEF